MASVAHTLPASIKFRDGSGFGVDQPGVKIVEMDSGPTKSRREPSRDRRTFEIVPIILTKSTTAYEEWEMFLTHISDTGLKGWVVDPLSGTHRNICCGPLGDASNATFQASIIAPSDVQVYVEDTPIFSGYSLRSAANILADAVAACSDASLWTASNCAIADSSVVSYDGLSSLKVTPAGGANPLIYLTDKTTGVAAAGIYSPMCYVLASASAAQNYNIRYYWYEADDTPIGTAMNGSDVSVSPGVWTALTAPSVVAPALAAKYRIAMRRNDTSGTDPFFVDCMGLNHGDYLRWHLSSQAPGLIHFSAGSIPAADERVTITATGQRVVYCQLTPGKTWKRSSPGHATLRSIHAREVLEY